MDVPCLQRLTGFLLLASLATPLRADEPLPPGAKVRLGTTRFRHGGTVRAVAFSADGKRIASAGTDRMVRIWETRTGRALVVIEGMPVVGETLAFSPDGKQLAVASYSRGAHVWDPEPGKLLWRAEQSGGSTQVAWSPDGKLLACAGSGGSVTLWTESGRLLHTLGPYPGRVCGLGFTPDGGQVLAFSGKAILRRWDTAS